jgi:PIN domain nuclease of toxin-antitoxin system
MAHVLLDASALLAAIFEEPGAEIVQEVLRGDVAMSTVSVAEVAARLHQNGWAATEVTDIIAELGIELVPFETDAALLSGQYRPATQRLGLGLGDRACLATSRLCKWPVLTADRDWRKLNLHGVSIRFIR